MYSTRLPWQAPANAISRVLSRKRAEGAQLLDLTASNPTAAGFRYPEERILEGFQKRAMLAYDPDPAGSLAAREHLAREFGFDPSRLVLTSSTSEAYGWLFKLLCAPGDEVLFPRPSYPLFDHLATLESVTGVPYPIDYCGGWSLDPEAVHERITSRTRAVVIINPNNPTGSYVTPKELQGLDALCERYDLALISDEVFSNYSFDQGRIFKPAALVCQCVAFSLNGLSKMAGLPQMKLAWIATNNSQAQANLELIADTYLSVGTPVQQALPDLLQVRIDIQRQVQQRLRINLAHLLSRMHTRPVEGGWNAVLQVPCVRSEEEWVLRLLDRDVLVQPGFFYDFSSEAFLIVSLLTHPEIFEEGVSRFDSLLD